jgi:hypothetical protein
VARAGPVIRAVSSQVGQGEAMEFAFFIELTEPRRYAA